jgi:hypothetical protein
MPENPLCRIETSCQLDEISTPVLFFFSGDIFWNISSRLFYTARILFVILLRTSRIQIEAERVATVNRNLLYSEYSCCVVWGIRKQCNQEHT